MTILSARLTQGPSEVKRYMLDWTQQLTVGETVIGVTVTIAPVTTPPIGAVNLVINNIVIAPLGLTAVFYVSAGTNLQNYEATFLATTSAGQVFEDVIEVDVVEKT